MKDYIQEPLRFERCARTTVDAFRGVDYACAITHYPREKEPIWKWVLAIAFITIIIAMVIYHA